MRSRVHMLTVAAARLEREHAGSDAVTALKEAARAESERHADGRAWSAADEKRIEQQRTLFAMLPSYAACDQLKAGMLQRAYDLMWDGDTSGCDAIAEFLPAADVEAMFAAWEADTLAVGDADRSDFYRGEFGR